MAFTTLEQRFKQRATRIYNKFSPSSDQLVVVKPNTEGTFGSENRIEYDTRAVPVISVLRDQSRISKFLSSPEGRLFVRNQTLLQTGNTFANSTIYNPLSARLSVVPFIHPRRHLVGQALLKPDAPGLLQNATVNTVSGRFQIAGLLQQATSRGALPPLLSVARSALSTTAKNLANKFIPLPQNYTSSRPEYKTFYGATAAGPILFAPQPLNQRGIPRLIVSANLKNAVISAARTAITNAAKAAFTRSLSPKLQGQVPTSLVTPPEPPLPFVAAAKAFRENFYNKNKQFNNISRFKNYYFSEFPNKSQDREEVNTTNLTALNAQTNKDTQIYKDNFNSANYQYKILDELSTERTRAVQLPPETTTRPSDITKLDIITFRFNNGGTGIPFRALISSIKESIKPEFSDQRYVGRTERFVTYGGVKRGVSLGFNVVAFSQNEIDTMWNRVNYLTGLAFPKGVSNGFMIPPLFNITIGKIYDNQPCYIESLDYDFLDESITFDIDNEVPLAINVTMQLSLLEKRSRFYDSPFYKITENQASATLAASSILAGTAV